MLRLITLNRLCVVNNIQEKKTIDFNLERKRKQLLMTKYILHNKIHQNCVLHIQSYNVDIVKDIKIVNRKLRVLNDEIQANSKNKADLKSKLILSNNLINNND